MKTIPFLLAAAVVSVGCDNPAQPDSATAVSFKSDRSAQATVIRVAAPTG